MEIDSQISYLMYKAMKLSGFSDESVKTEVLCYKTCRFDKIKISPLSQTTSAKERPSPVMVICPNE